MIGGVIMPVTVIIFVVLFIALVYAGLLLKFLFRRKKHKIVLEVDKRVVAQCVLACEYMGLDERMMLRGERVDRETKSRETVAFAMNILLTTLEIKKRYPEGRLFFVDENGLRHLEIVLPVSEFYTDQAANDDVEKNSQIIDLFAYVNKRTGNEIN